jgi:hypothetical protein
MTGYQIIVEFRKGGCKVSDIYPSKASAIEALKKIANYTNDEFGGNLDEGTYYTEEESYEVAAVSMIDIGE